MQDPAVLHRQFSSAVSHWPQTPIHWRDTWIWKPRKKELLPGGGSLTFSASTDRNSHTAVTRTWHTQRARFLHLSANLTMPWVWVLHQPKDPISSIPCLQRDLLTKGWRAKWIGTGGARGSHAQPQPQICQDSSHGTTCSISFHNHVNETPLKASQYQNSQHVTLKMGRTEAFFWKWSFKSVCL